MTLAEKINGLTRFIENHDAAAIAFSGGVDSSFLTKTVYEVLGSKSLAITIDSPFIPRAEMEVAKKTAAEIGIRHKILTVDNLPSAVLENDLQRCYQCKTAVFSLILDTIRAENISTLFDGTNLDDLSDYRPGMKALQELKVKSPLLECGFSKQDIRQASKDLGLSTWDHPSLACLASRIPYRVRITGEALEMVEKAEEYLKSLDFTQLRVRYHNDLARIEVAAEERHKLFDTGLMDNISDELKTFGFKFVSLDLEGYKIGKMN